MAKKLDHMVFNFMGGTAEKSIEDAKRILNYSEIAKDKHPSIIMQEVARQAGKRKSLLFNLSPHFNFDDFKKYLKEWRPRTGGSPGSEFTNDELAFILSDKEIFDRVRWFREGRELTFDELREAFGQLAPDLFRAP